MKYTYTFNSYENPGIESLYHVGDAVLVYSREKAGNEYFDISKEFAEEGYPGNLDRSVKRFHGWRGETNNINTYAHGVYSIKSIEKKAGKYAPDEFVKITLNRTDIKKGEE